MKHPGIYSKLCYIHMAIYVIYFAALEILPVRNFLNQHLGVIHSNRGIRRVFTRFGLFFPKDHVPNPTCPYSYVVFCGNNRINLHQLSI